MVDKKRVFLVPSAVFLCAAALFLSGCGAAGEHEKAIENAVVSYSDYYIEVRDLHKQVRSQYNDSGSGESAAEYTVTADIPNYLSLEDGAVPFDPPAPDYTLTASQYRRNTRLLLRQALETYALNNELPSYVEVPLTFTVYRSGSSWEAALSGVSKNEIQRTVDSMTDEILSSSAAYMEYELLSQIADAKDPLLEDVFGGADYVSYVRVTDVADDGNGLYALYLYFPDPSEVFGALADDYYSSYNQPFYGDEAAVSLPADDLSNVTVSSMRLVSGSAVVSRGADGALSLSDASSVETLIASAKASAEESVAARINAEWRVPEQEAPSSGTILEGESRGNDIVFVSNADLGKYYYVRFYRLSGDDASEEGELTAGVFIKGGKKATVRLPSGYYRIDCFVGEAWYGLDGLFGDAGQEFSSGNTVQSLSGYVNTISFN